MGAGKLRRSCKAAKPSLEQLRDTGLLERLAPVRGWGEYDEAGAAAIIVAPAARGATPTFSSTCCHEATKDRRGPSDPRAGSPRLRRPTPYGNTSGSRQLALMMLRSLAPISLYCLPRPVCSQGAALPAGCSPAPPADVDPPGRGVTTRSLPRTSLLMEASLGSPYERRLRTPAKARPPVRPRQMGTDQRSALVEIRSPPEG